MRKREKISTFPLRSTEIGWSSSDKPRFKVGVLGESYVWIPETPSFAKVLHGRFGESKASEKKPRFAGHEHKMLLRT